MADLLGFRPDFLVRVGSMTEWCYGNLVPRRGFEPLTCPLGGGRAIQLCHRGLSLQSIALAARPLYLHRPITYSCNLS